MSAVICLYALFHLPRVRHGAVLAAMAGWLRPGGRLLFNVGASDNPGAMEVDWLGAPMFWSNFAPDVTRSLVEAAGLTIDWAETIAEGPERHFWIAAVR